MDIKLESVVPTEVQVEELYRQLSGRAYNISHEQMPIYTDHEKFVVNHPYRAWYIIRVDGKSKGNLYVQNDNSIGLNGLEGMDDSCIKEVLGLVRQRLSPLEPIPSVRYKDFYLNIAADNDEMQLTLEKLGYKALQVSYIPEP